MSAAADTDLPPRGLPERLPEGETILWQGAPSASAIARRALHGRHVALYFLLAAVFVAGMAWNDGRPAASIGITVALIALACAAVLGLIAGFATLVARTTVYTITNRRTVMRLGIALPVTLNLPHSSLEGAGLRLDADGSGDIPLALGGTGRIGFVHLWPHARPWRVGRPEPMMRGVPEAAKVAAILARAAGAGPLGRAAAVRADSAHPAEGLVPSRAA